MFCTYYYYSIMLLLELIYAILIVLGSIGFIVGYMFSMVLETLVCAYAIIFGSLSILSLVS